MGSPVEIRGMLRQVFLSALAEASIEKAFGQHVNYEKGVLRICEDLYALSDFECVFVVSLGKAAHTMAGALGAQLGVLAQGIVAAPTAPATMLHGFSYYEGGHPLPTAGSLRAASAILRALEKLDERSLVIYLISGGGSAIVERPAFAEISLEDLIATYRVLVHSGAPIAQINAIRKHLSAVKGGRMAAAAPRSRQVSVMVSDVPEAALDSLASGPTMPDPTTVEDCYRLAERYALLPQFPPSVRNLFERRALGETPKADDGTFANSRWWVLLSNSSLETAAAGCAAREGFVVAVDNTCDDWDYAAAADYLLNRVRELRRSAARVCLISGGEVTVTVTNPGCGGRNQQFALYCATKIAGENIAVLSAGSDGIDGNSPSAGAVADGTTIGRALAQGLDPVGALTHFDSFPVFEALDDAIITGPTGNNVRDLRILVAW
jgi:glycerate 2-kinase